MGSSSPSISMPDKPNPFKDRMTRRNESLPDGAAQGAGQALRNKYNFRSNDIIIAVMGVTGVGKSSFISLFAEENVVIGHSLEACTSDVRMYRCNLVSDRRLFLIDTPGFDDTYKSDTDILREVANWLSEAYENKIQLTGIIYLHRIADVRLGGSAMKNLRMFKKLCGENSLASVVLATTRWSDVDEEVGLKRESELTTNLQFWASMIAKGSTVFRHDRELESAMEIVSYLVEKRRPIILDIAKEMVDSGRPLDETSAGKEVTAEMAEQKARFEEQLKDIKADMDEALAKRDKEWHDDLEAEKRETVKKLQKEEGERLKLQADWERLRKEKDEELAKERERATAQLIESKERMLKHEHELVLMREQHANSRALAEKQFELEKMRADNARMKKAEEEDCVVM